MRKELAVIMALILCLTAWPAGVFAEGDAAAYGDASLRDSEDVPAVTAVSPAFQKKDFKALNAAGKLSVSEGITLSEESGKDGLVLKGKGADLNAGRITIAEDFDFGEKPASRRTDLGPVGRVTVDGLSDIKSPVKMNIYLDDETEPRATIVLRRKMGKIGWNRKGERTLDVLSQKITGKHHISIGFETESTEKITLLLRYFMFCENSVPVMYFDLDETEGSIDAMNSSADHTAECYGTVTVQVPEGYKGEFSDKVLTTTDPLDLDYIRGRGNSTWSLDKKPYKVKLDKAYDLLGMGKNKHWVLLANRYDNTLLRNRITYWIVRNMGMEYAIKCAPVEVVMNGEYYGSYLLSQQVRVDKTRVEIDKLDEAVKDPGSLEITGGYLLNMEAGDDEYGEICLPSGGLFGLESPDFADYPDTAEAKEAKLAQYNYIKDFLTKVDNAILGKDMKDSEGRPFSDYMDEQSAADFWWIQEFSINGDAFCNGSNYLYKKRDVLEGEDKVKTGKLYWGPLWDFDYVAWGNPNNNAETISGFNNTSNMWMSKLRTREDFQQRLKARWSASEDKDHMNTAHLDTLLTEVTKENGVLDRYYEETRVSEYYDNVKLGFFNEGGGYDSYAGTGASLKKILQAQNEEQGDDPAPIKEPQTYESEIEQLRGWIIQRQAWVNENLQDISPAVYTINFFIDSKIVETRTCIEGEQYGELPKAPEKKNYTFTGWYNEYGEEITAESYVWESSNITAKYVSTSKLKQPVNIYFKDYDVYTWHTGYEDEDYYCPSYTVMPKDAPECKIEWSVSDPKIATVNEDGYVYSKGVGTVTVTAKLPSGKKNSYKLTFLSPEEEVPDLQTLKITKKSLSIKAGSYTQLRTKCEPSPHSQADFCWFSTDPKIASVDDYGIIKARSPGSTILIVYDLNSRKNATCKVTVTKSKAYAKSVKVSGVKASAAKKGAKRTVKVSWKKASGVSGYYVLRAASKNGKYKKVGTVKKAGSVKWTDSKVKKGKKYFYKVQAYTKLSGKTYKGKRSAAAFVKVK